jgi:hypothetical protein
MTQRQLLAATVLTIGLLGLLPGCSSGNVNKGSQGSLAITMGATGASAPLATEAAAAGVDDALSQLKAAVVTIAGIEARTGDGNWVPLDTGLPVDFDLIKFIAAGNAAALPADLLPEGDYDALELRITSVKLTLLNDSTVGITPPGTGWTVRTLVSFSVVAGRSTVVNLILHGPGSFKFFDGEYGFDPEIEATSVEHD